MVMLRNFPPNRARRQYMPRGCCCGGITPSECFNVTAGVVCGADEFLCEYRNQNDLPNYRVDRWQPYCLRGLVYKSRAVTTSGQALYANILNLDDYDICVTRTNTGQPKDADCLTSLYFGRRKPYPDYIDWLNFGCVDLNPVVSYPSSINWRCVQKSDFLDALAQGIPENLRGVLHDVVVKVDYWRHIYGTCEGTYCGSHGNEHATFSSSDIHMFWIQAYAVFTEPVEE